MDEDFGSNFVTIQDEDGNEFELEQLATLEYGDREYSIFLPADMAADDPDYGYIILGISEENGEEFFSTVDDGDELTSVYEAFMQMLFPDGDGDENSEE